MADDMKKYLDLEGLKEYDKKVKALITDKVGDIKIATSESAGTVKPSDGLDIASDGTLKVKPKADGSISVTADGVDVDWTKGQKATAGTPGLMSVGNGLDVDDGTVSAKAKTSSGIAVTADGIGVSLKETNSGLAVGADGLSVNVKADGGVTSDTNGLSVDWTKAPKASTSDYGMVKLGTGLNLKEDGTIEVDSDTLENDSIDLSKIKDSDDLAKKSDLVNVYKYKGSVATIDALQAKETSANVGDVYNVESTGMNYGYVESGGDYNDHWDALGASFTITSITIGEIDELFNS